MAQPITIPEPLTLIPSLLAFLPTSFASSRPPPALLPLLSPILQQRVQIHTSSSKDAHESWLRLLCWDNAKAERLKDIVENANFEPHPVSGEVEIGNVDAIKYKRFDQETLRAHIPLADWDLSIVYVWCTGGDGGGGGDAWKLAELTPLDLDLEQDTTWSTSLADAEESFRQKNATTRPQSALLGARKLSVPGGDDDDYWAMYDSAPGRTPARKQSYNPTGSALNEDDYYARYGDVQPALDGHDPDEVQEGPEGSDLNGNALQELLAQNPLRTKGMEQSVSNGPLSTHKEEEETSIPVRQPTPSSPRSRAGSDTVEKLEYQAEKYAASEIGIRHHIGYSVKSMYRLAKSAGINRQEFEDMVQRELETLSILDRDD